MVAHLSNHGDTPSRSRQHRFSFERTFDQQQNFNNDHSSLDTNNELQFRNVSEESSEVHSVGNDGSNKDDLSENELTQQNSYQEFLTTSLGVPEFDPDLIQSEYASNDLFDDNDGEREAQSDPVEQCEIVDIVVNPAGRLTTVSSGPLGNRNIITNPNGSTSDPIFVEDTCNHPPANSHEQHSIAADVENDNHSVSSNISINSSDSRDQDNDDVIMGAIHWNHKRPPQFPIDYYRPNRNISNTYKFLDDNSVQVKNLEDIEFLFKCPICYSTITRLRSGKVPNESDKVIYSTKCGHLFCYECIEKVRSRRECSICRKRLTDRNPYHVVYP